MSISIPYTAFCNFILSSDIRSGESFYTLIDILHSDDAIKVLLLMKIKSLIVDMKENTSETFTDFESKKTYILTNIERTDPITYYVYKSFINDWVYTVMQDDSKKK